MIAALVLCAGRSERFGRDKLQLDLGGRPVWRWSADTLACHPRVDWVGIVCAPERELEFAGPWSVITGGADRQESARLGLDALPKEATHVLIHDGARPFVSGILISRVIEALDSAIAAFPALPVTDTIKQRGPRWSTLDRSTLYAVQTPQGGAVQALREAHARALPGAIDDMMPLELAGIEPVRVEGDITNRKITTEEDYIIAAMSLWTPMETRTGFGYDIHAFSQDPSRPLMLGGVHFPGERALEGHSDADVLLHAVVDALLGGAASGDIGHLYPDTDPAWKNAPSIRFLMETGERLRVEGWRVVHVDCTVLAETPKIMPRSAMIRQTIADALRLTPDRVSLKATTHERLGTIGRGEGIAALASATLERPRPTDEPLK